MRTKQPPPEPSVYDQAVKHMMQGRFPAITRVETSDKIGVFAVSHDFTGAPYLRRNAFHHSKRRRALAAFAMVQFARKIAREDGFKPIP